MLGLLVLLLGLAAGFLSASDSLWAFALGAPAAFIAGHIDNTLREGKQT